MKTILGEIWYVEEFAYYSIGATYVLAPNKNLRFYHQSEKTVLFEFLGTIEIPTKGSAVLNIIKWLKIQGYTPSEDGCGEFTFEKL